ncbi:hypothetical protein AN639_08280 [Candidatus Epulonipiscium fishelsonii]|uniref:Uncharacterized protein n=1 Tax=Candidatus Epulonipiscium fishelsonii TaxID=77094 RepID=A0ACC8XHD2_9FIRM|nr:hypothetical protein AN639_08280 [Epulopiscium sp. SCG-B05WGA-EpuloA1]ONI43023.1 hypothetical protein AN396_00235 [Epulopiscium sp. SCG-B11WGA-EpuloA1]
MINILKVGILLIVTIASLEIASVSINHMVMKVQVREQTIVDALVKKQVEQKMKDIEQEIEIVLEQEDITIQTEEAHLQQEVVEVDPNTTYVEIESVIDSAPTRPLEIETKEQDLEILPENDSNNTEVVENNSILVEEQTLEVENLESLFEDASSSKYNIAKYLVDNYFLDGYVYYTKEQDPILKERKKWAHQMEVYIIDSLLPLMEPLKDLSNIKEYDFEPIKDNVIKIASDFDNTYGTIAVEDEIMEPIFKGTQQFFDKYVELVTIVQDVITSLEQTSNPALVFPILIKQLNQKILPSTKEILDVAFEVKDLTNQIYLQGVEGVDLLSTDQVVQIVFDSTKSMQQDVLSEFSSPKQSITTEQVLDIDDVLNNGI